MRSNRDPITPSKEVMMYYDDDDRGVLDFLAGVALGALLGAGIALLLAPQTGRKTRRQIARAAEDLGETTGERIQSAADEVRRAATDARRAAERSGARIRDKISRN